MAGTRGQACADELAHALASAVQMRAHGVDGHFECGGDGLITAILLVVEDEDGAFGFGEGEQRGVDGGLQLGVGEELVGIAGVGVEGVAGKIFEPLGGGFVFLRGGRGGDELALAAAVLPLVLRDVDNDAEEISGERGVAAELGQCTVEAEEDLLREVFDVRARAGHAREGAEDHRLMLADDGFEGFRRCEIDVHGCQRRV